MEGEGKKRLNKRWLFAGIAAAVVLIAAAIAWFCWYDAQPRFCDVTIELGQTEVPIQQFLTKYAKEEKASFVTDMAALDYTQTGEHFIQLQHGKKRQETVRLLIQDTTAPAVEFADILRTTDYVPNADDFIASVQDYSEVTAAFVQVPVITGYQDQQVEIVVTDAAGNETTGQCTLSLTWLQEHFALEYGTQITAADILLDAEKDGALVSQELLDEINGYPVGEYAIDVAADGVTRTMQLVVQDTTPPEIKLRDVTIYVDEKAEKNDFIVSVKDISEGETSTELVSKLTFGKKGTQTVTIAAEDVYGNRGEATAKLVIVEDTKGPEISGLSAMTVAKHSTPDYNKGVSAADDHDGQVSFSVDSSQVNTGKAGTYYAVYTARDSRGNATSTKRKVVVNHDAEDTRALIREMAKECGNTPEAIRNYVVSTIRYNSNWGGDDPVWYGFTEKRGNCYVHALCFQALLREKGYTTQLIWVTDKSHYWNQVMIGGSWKHMDATPSSIHGRYLIMNDVQRLETLSGRVWDTAGWPACN